MKEKLIQAAGKILTPDWDYIIAPEIQDEIRNTKKAVLVSTHTSFWDGIHNLHFKYHPNITEIIAPGKIKIAIKKEFCPPFVQRLGGIPVDRSNGPKAFNDMETHFRDSDEIILAIAPEGTRKQVKRLKGGAFRIAAKNQVPILLGYVDYKDKEAGIGGIIRPEEFDNIQFLMREFYENVVPKYPENFNKEFIVPKVN